MTGVPECPEGVDHTALELARALGLARLNMREKQVVKLRGQTKGH